MLRRPFTLRAVACALWLAFAPAAPAAEPPHEYQVKAVFLLRFAQFVTWPAGAFAGPEAPLVIGVLGEDPFGRFLDDAVEGERVNGRPVVLRRFASEEAAARSHILFVSRSERGRFGAILQRLEGLPVLTVADTSGFIGRGGIIRFVVEANRIRFHIDAEAARTRRLALSSKLLSAAAPRSEDG